MTTPHTTKTMAALFAATTLASTPLWAGEIATPPLPDQQLQGDVITECVARNRTEDRLRVTIQGNGPNGRRVALVTMDLLPGTERRIAPEAVGGRTPALAACRFSFTGRNSLLDGRIEIRDPSSERVVTSLRAR